MQVQFDPPQSFRLGVTVAVASSFDDQSYNSSHLPANSFHLGGDSYHLSEDSLHLDRDSAYLARNSRHLVANQEEDMG
jgi:hypothetical protein